MEKQHSFRRRHSLDEKTNYHDLKKSQESNYLSNNNWNGTQEKVLQQRGEQSLGYRWMHDRSCKNLIWYNNLLGILGIIFGTLGGTGALVNIAINNTYIEILVGIASYISAVSTALIKFLALDTRATEHKSAAIKFQAFSSEIINQLAMKRCDRKSGNEYMEATRLQFDRLVGEAPSIEQNVLNEFSKKFGEKDIAKPDVANGIDSIYIRTGNTSNQETQKKVLEIWKSSPTKDVEKNEDSVIIENTNSNLQEEFEKQLREREKEEISKRVAYQMSRVQS